jgi:hypothetical protein
MRNVKIENRHERRTSKEIRKDRPRSESEKFWCKPAGLKSKLDPIRGHPNNF